jgi:hypothetical protein
MTPEWEEIGEVGVDAGLCWIGDPCYILHTNTPPKAIGTTWHEFCAKVINDHTQFNYDIGHTGLGVCVSTGYGDGSYPVYIKRDPDTGRIAEVRVAFISNEDEG